MKKINQNLQFFSDDASINAAKNPPSRLHLDRFPSSHSSVHNCCTVHYRVSVLIVEYHSKLSQRLQGWTGAQS